ncbi:MAG: DUF6489 family protein [Nevskia sp.]|nr:DUF6489 family protein [Nevskia sp.]
MQIRIEIDVKPEELRRFLGLPDVAGLQEDLVNFLRDKLGAAAETFDPASFVKDNLQTLRQSAPWQLLVSATTRSSASTKAAPDVPEPQRASKPAAKAAGGAAKKAVRKRKAVTKLAGTPPDNSKPE